MSEPIRLWRNGDSAIFVRGAVDANLLRYRPDAVEYAALPRAEYDALVKERDAATARAEKAEALLREVRAAFASGGVCDECRFSARIDALLGEAPTPDDRKGEDGEALDAATGGA